jgi:hypothetical protein
MCLVQAQVPIAVRRSAAKMGTTAQALANVGGQGSDVGALAASHLEDEAVVGERIG